LLLCRSISIKVSSSSSLDFFLNKFLKVTSDFLQENSPNLTNKSRIIYLKHTFLVVSVALMRILRLKKQVFQQRLTGWRRLELSLKTKYGGRLRALDPLRPLVKMALLKNGIEVLINPLRKIFTACLAFGYIPKPGGK
jgi:hypothetical protein